MATRRNRSTKRTPPSASHSRPTLPGLLTPRHPPARAVSEPAESEHMTRVNEALEVIERCARTVIDAGGEYALRQRLGRLMRLDTLTTS